MTKTKIDDLAQDAEELDTDEQKQVKGGAIPVVDPAAVLAGRTAIGAALPPATGMTMMAALAKKKAGYDTYASLQKEASQQAQTNPLFQAKEDVLKQDK